MTNGRLLLAVLLAGLAGCLGAIAADRWLNHEDNGSLHQFVHEELVLTEDQNSRLETLEARFAVERAALESSLRAANARLAQAMDAEHEYGPEVSAAIDDVHGQMGELQKATVQHVFDMREILEPEQQRLFDRKVSEALTSNSRD
ncbi:MULTISPECIES: periplasmic heavy metal sensor [Erythrobacteraceae]|uniref:Heavy metal resistance protein n=1 Tax=Erythrobacter westpacificensis TaxID=1055231 RepID=A0ABP9KNW4_9SPHN|nr:MULTISPECIES: periplasmic heavy metal sensor [Erythrobacteraceae]MBW3168036.1 periplasmic heavy metal sensor [Qipengyuania flava]MBY5965274.1 periplasmic heavy metal sensor [Qipengyuania flava]MBY6011598.1 periplasmic heavy metal sensor [Qipengyuania flava]MBY6026040.1 periplasmic heavy metal sensor [Qipengyuania flava]WPZ08405.1 periplasmic heavy metal sensor [Pelagerythrobacter marinus]